MKSSHRLAAIAALAAASIGGFAAITIAESPAPAVIAAEKPLAQAPTVSLPDFRVIAKRVVPAVVTVRSEKEIAHNAQAVPPGFGDFFGRFFGQPPQGGGDDSSFTQRGLGSGVIVSADGYVLTNNHVVEGVDRIEVVTSAGDTLAATVVGTDPKSDLAVLKIEGQRLSPVSLGNSDALEVGEWVLAVGNPFSERLGATVTAGIVSATGRNNLDIADYEDFIQTDAAVNPGNSGGALVNTRGELIGINTAIVSRGGGFQGVSFAIPIKMAKQVMDQLVAHGRVSRGYLGVGIQNVDKELAAGLGLDSADGVLVREVMPSTPAARAGLERGDGIVGLDAAPVKDVTELRTRVAALKPGTRAKLDLKRDGKLLHVSLDIAELEDQSQARAAAEPAPNDLGLQLHSLEPGFAERLGYQNESGALVMAVTPGSAAGRAGLRQGDLIKEVNRTRVTSPKSYDAAVAASPKGRPLVLYVRRGADSMYVTIKR